MSVPHMNLVFEHSRSEGSARLVMLALAWYADDDGLAWPSIAALAQRAKVGERQIQRVLTQLEALGEIAVERARGRTHTSTYRVMIAACLPFNGDTAMSPFTGSKGDIVVSPLPEIKGDIWDTKGDISSIKGDTQDVKGDIAMSPERQERQEIQRKTEGADAPPRPPPAEISEKRKINARWRTLTDERNLNPAQLTAALSVLTLYSERGEPDRFFGYMDEAARKRWRFDGFLGAARDRLDKPESAAPKRGSPATVRAMSPPEPDAAWADAYNQRQIAKLAAKRG